ncbi:MAG TPA: 4Fe-4S dicluster domain-containing protein [Dissulfurispiraceae bacterium]|nr:4Fe-4S dicluster domain-containing protein [Dissulfurispiraceae bacterium]
MEYMRLNKKNLAVFIEELQNKCEVWGPVKQGEQVKFAPISGAADINLDGFKNTTMSPKEIFFPQSEIMLSFRREGEDANIYRDEQAMPSKKAIIGIRPCDARAFRILDMIFKNDQFADNYWLSKRDAVTLVGLGCTEPCGTCFCTSVNSHPFDETGLDVMVADLGEHFLLKSLTKKGRELLAGSHVLREPSEANIEAYKTLRKNAENAMTIQFGAEKVNAKTVLELFSEDYWQRVAEPCLNCSTCSYVCPTCHCFDIQDEVFRGGGERVRNWESCMSWIFTVHATGHNPRPGKKERVRQRFMHKFKYIPMKRNGEIGCVGCGRCVTLCPVNIDIREVVKQMNS